MIKRHGKHNREDGEGMEHTAEGKGVKQVINGIDILKLNNALVSPPYITDKLVFVAVYRYRTGKEMCKSRAGHNNRQSKKGHVFYDIRAIIY